MILFHFDRTKRLVTTALAVCMFVGATAKGQGHLTELPALGDPFLKLHLSTLALPDLIFHWTNKEGLERLTPDIGRGRYKGTLSAYYRALRDVPYLKVEFDGALPLCPTQTSMAAGYRILSAEQKDVVFFSDNPVAGLGTDLENYTRVEYKNRRGPIERLVDLWNGEPDAGLFASSSPRIITAKVDPTAEFSIIATHGGSNSHSRLQVIKLKDVKNPDLIYHIHFDSFGVLASREWILVNSKKIIWFSANPEVARPYIEKELEHFKDPRFKYGRFDKVICEQPLPKYFRRILEEALKVPLNEIPPYYRGLGNAACYPSLK